MVIGISGIFYVTITGNLECFQYFNIETKFLKNKNVFFFQKLQNSFIVENTTIKTVTYPYKTVLSEANVKANRMGSRKWTYHKESSFVSIYFIFWKILVQYKNNGTMASWLRHWIPNPGVP